VPLPVGAVQLVLAWLNFGLFDGDLINNVASDGFISSGVVRAGVLLAVTAAVGLLAVARHVSCIGFADCRQATSNNGTFA
jgi:hypothetical protein